MLVSLEDGCAVLYLLLVVRRDLETMCFWFGDGVGVREMEMGEEAGVHDGENQRRKICGSWIGM